MLLGNRPGGAAISSVTKSGFPPVVSNSSAASRPEPAASAATASSLSGAERELGDVGAPSGAEQPAQGMGQTDLLTPVGQDDDHRQLAHAAGELADHVERRVVGPVDVLDHDDAPVLRADGREDP